MMMIRWVLPLLMAGTVHAEVALPPGFSAYPGSSVVQTDTLDNTDYELVLGTLKKVRGRLTPERAERIRGRLTRTTWRLPDGRDPGEVFNVLVAQVEAHTRDVLYVCQRRDCGSSNDWANHVFGVAQLYGPDDDQYYLAARFRQQASAGFAAIYVVRRGNQRLYAHLDWLETSADAAASVHPNPATLLDLLKKHRRVELQRIRFGEQQSEPDVAPEVLQTIVQALQQDLSVHVAVVAHSVTGQGIARDLQLSQGRARAVTDLLVQGGIARERLYPFGAGSLVPPLHFDGRRDRVELVLP